MPLSGVLAGRYEVLDELGRGGMAEVHRAHDRTLDREVAVKVLHRRFSDDEEFQARFRQEAQSAASLNHPNIVAVYDTGEQDGLPFFVMEVVEGRSLADVVRRGGLTEERALEVAADVCAALRYAHERGLVHRDVKPGNILLAEDGAVKVADFGIARAIDADTVTQTAAILGTAAYLSPEQAQGRQATGQSDLYSLGVVLYELLTGEQPFQGDSPVTVAYQHVQEAPLPPRDLDASLSPQAESIVMRALAKNPTNRYSTAGEMRDDLLRARAGQPVVAPPVLHRDDTAALDVDEVRAVGQRSRVGRVVGYLALAAATVAAAAFGVSFLADAFVPEPAASVAVPRVVGEQSDVASRILTESGLEMRIARQETSESVPPGAIVSQDPPAGGTALEGTSVQVVTSLGPSLVTVPDVTGLSLDDARQALRDLELVPGAVQVEPSDEVAEDVVLRSAPEGGATVSPLTPVDLVVSGGLGTVRLTSVVGFTEADARFRLASQGIDAPLVLPVFSDTVPEGVVVAQDPAPGTELDVGDPVTIEVSQGPAEPEPSPTPEPTPEPEPSPTPEPTPEPEPSPTPEPTPEPSPTDQPTP